LFIVEKSQEEMASKTRLKLKGMKLF